MIKRRNFLKSLTLSIGDILVFFSSMHFALFLRYYKSQEYQSLLSKHYLPFSIIFLSWMLIFYSFSLYDPRLMKNSKLFLYRLLKAMSVGLIVAILIFYLLPFLQIEPRRNLLSIVSLSTILIFTWRYIFNILVIKTSASRVIFFGASKETIELAEYLLKNRQIGQIPVAFITNGSGQESELPLAHYQLNHGFKNIIQETKADTIVIPREIKENREIVRALFQTIPLGLRITELHNFYEALTGKVPVSVIGEIWFLENLIGVRKYLWEAAKRFIDLLLGIILTIPVMILFPFIALAIKTESPGPIFFRQKRVGRNGRIFNLLKYRSTFRTEVGKNDGWEKENSSVYTESGKFLRKIYLDELPQIINIMKGEMSFVGPRPERPEFVDELKQQIPFYEMRLLVPPGISGWAQINMENDASAKDAPVKMQYDLYYVKNRSFILDLLIMLRTFFTLLQREGK